MKHTIFEHGQTMSFSTDAEYIQHHASDCITFGLTYPQYVGFMAQWVAGADNTYTLSHEAYEAMFSSRICTLLSEIERIEWVLERGAHEECRTDALIAQLASMRAQYLALSGEEI